LAVNLYRGSVFIAGSQHCVHANKSVNVNTIKKCIKKISSDDCPVSFTAFYILLLWQLLLLLLHFLFYWL